jgi:hypothetical protein
VAAEYFGVSGRVELDAMGDRYDGDYDFYMVSTDGWQFWWESVEGAGRAGLASPE